MKEVGLEAHLVEWRIWWVEQRVEKPVHEERKAREEEENTGLDLGHCEFARAWPEGKGAPGCHPRTRSNSCFTFNVTS